MQIIEKISLWNSAFLVNIYRNAILSDAVGVSTLCKQKNRITNLNFVDIRFVYKLSRLG